MGKNLKRLMAMVRAHAAFTHTAKGQVGIGHVHHGVVDATTTKLDIIQHFAFHLGTFGEQVKRQRMLRQCLHLLIDFT